jgi:hypothetical protein
MPSYNPPQDNGTALTLSGPARLPAFAKSLFLCRRSQARGSDLERRRLSGCGLTTCPRTRARLMPYKNFIAITRALPCLLGAVKLPPKKFPVVVAWPV